MKTFKTYTLFLALVCFSISCSKTERIGSGFEDVFNQQSATSNTAGMSASVIAANMVPGEQNIIPSDITFCNPKSVPLCTDNETVGTVTLKRGANNKVYITYSLTGNFYLAACNLYTGTTAAIPVIQREANVCGFPYKKSTYNNYTTQQYTFVLNNQPESFTVAAHAEVVKKQGNTYKKQEDAWADGCSGTPIISSSSNGNGQNGHDCQQHGSQSAANKNGNSGCDHNDNNNNDDDDDGKKGNGKNDDDDDGKKGNGKNDDDDDGKKGNGNYDDDDDNNSEDCRGGNWATRFTYTGGNCIQPAAEPEPDICSFPIQYFFGIHPIHGQVMPWKHPTVTVGGFDYTEAEGRAIAAVVFNSTQGNAHDAQQAFLNLATFKLSYTGYTMSPTMAPVVTTLETWMSTLGKLSPEKLPPGGNAAVRDANTKIASFMTAHTCPDREE